MKTPEEFAREALGCHVETVEPGRTASGQRYCGRHHQPWLSDVDMCPAQERVADLIRARDAEVAARALREAADEVYGDDRAAGPYSHPLSGASWLRERADLIERGEP